MKLLFDQNLSPRLPRMLAVEFAASAHVREFGLARGTDPVVWRTRRRKGLSLHRRMSIFNNAPCAAPRRK